MKERLRDHLSEVGESFDCLRSDVRNLSRHMAELEELIEGYRTFAVTLTPSTPGEWATLRKLLKKTLNVVGPAPEELPTLDARSIPDGASAPHRSETSSMIQ